MSHWAVGLLAAVTLSCLAVAPAGETTFTVDVDKDVYEAEEHGDVTMIWTFTVEGRAQSLYIDVSSASPHRMVFCYSSKSEAQRRPHDFYRGRVGCDQELIQTGRIQCLFTDLRLNDTGTYLSYISTDTNSGYKTCYLNVTKTSNQTTNEVSKQPEGRERIGLFAGLCVFTVSTLMVLVARRLFGAFWNR